MSVDDLHRYTTPPAVDDHAGEPSEGPCDEFSYARESKTGGLRWYAVAVIALVLLGSILARCQMPNTSKQTSQDAEK